MQSPRNVLLATAFFALWCVTAFRGVIWADWARSWDTAAFALYFAMMIVLPPAAVGILVGRFWFGLVCGALSTASFMVWFWAGPFR